MKPDALIHHRLKNQGLINPSLPSPYHVVKHLCAIQAQDFFGSLWSVGQRLKNCTERDVEMAIRNREIIRTWPMRGTLHFVAAEDAKWMLKLLTPRVVARAGTLYRQQGLDKATLNKATKIIAKVLGTSGPLTRAAIYEELEKNKISVSDQRGLHLISYAAHQQVICCGPRQGKQHTFVLFDEWVTNSRDLRGDEALAELAERYFDGHGPATLDDFCWWTGLTVKEAKTAVAAVSSKLTCIAVDGHDYWMKPGEVRKPRAVRARLLSWFDEYIIGYRDRSATIDPAVARFIEKPKNGLYTPVVIIDGKIAGTWRRELLKNAARIDLKLFRKLNAEEREAVDNEVERYERFVTLPKKIVGDAKIV